jgi:hypothetical protein
MSLQAFPFKQRSNFEAIVDLALFISHAAVAGSEAETKAYFQYALDPRHDYNDYSTGRADTNTSKQAS